MLRVVFPSFSFLCLREMKKESKSSKIAFLHLSSVLSPSSLMRFYHQQQHHSRRHRCVFYFFCFVFSLNIGRALFSLPPSTNETITGPTKRAHICTHTHAHTHTPHTLGPHRLLKRRRFDHTLYHRRRRHSRLPPKRKFFSRENKSRENI